MKRTQILTSKLLSAFTGLTITNAVVWVSSFAFLNLYSNGQEIDTNALLLLLLSIVLFQLFFLTVGMLIQPERSLGVPNVDRPQPHTLRWQMTALSVARLIVTPALIGGLVWLLKIDRAPGAVAVLQTAMPTAICTTAMTEQYGGDGSFAATSVVWTTLLSLITLPLWSVVVLGH